jgi:hypothetical protein
LFAVPLSNIPRQIYLHEQIQAGNRHAVLSPNKLFVDSNYLSGELIKLYRDRGQKLMGYLQGYGGREKAFQNEAFDIDLKTGTTVCPAGHRNKSSTTGKHGKLYIYFATKTCQSCANVERCVGTQNTATRRTLAVGPYYSYLRKRRFAQQTDKFKEEMRVRAQVEGTISEATRKHGLRYARYRGKDGHQFQFYLAGAVINAKRLMKAIKKEKSKMQIES